VIMGREETYVFVNGGITHEDESGSGVGNTGAAGLGVSFGTNFVGC
jgi:hypothetical protein